MRSLLIICICFISISMGATTLQVPVMLQEAPCAGKRVKVVPSEYFETDLYYSLYLPESWEEGGSYPVIVEYTGNKHAATGSTGEAKDASLGYAIAKNTNAIWLVLPYVKSDYTATTSWWGDEQTTIDYAINSIRDVCLNYNGNSGQVFITGFSRGAIAVNYLGLYNNEIADVWRGFFSHDHYDGARAWNTYWAEWNNLDAYRAAAIVRMQRMKGRAALVSNNSATNHNYAISAGLEAYGTMSYLKPDVRTAIEGMDLPHTHTDRWMLSQLIDAQTVFAWFNDAVDNNYGVYSVSGVVSDAFGNPIEGVIVDAGSIHFGITNSIGEYTIEGLIKGSRTIELSEDNLCADLSDPVIIDISDDVDNVDFTISRVSTDNEEVVNSIDASIFPNPVNSNIHITNTKAFNTIEIFDMRGNKLLSTEIKNVIDVSFLHEGIYISHLMGEGNSQKDIWFKK